MKKLLCSAAVIGLAIAATPAQAEDGLTLNIGGYFKGYTMWTDVDEEGTLENRDLDIIRNTEIHFGGETTLDNGLTVGFHTEAETDAQGTANDSFGVNETYAYFSGGWGRVNFGSEDGASYLLQVEAPSADDNIDGIRQFVNPVNYAAIEAGGTLEVFDVNGARSGLDYDQDLSGTEDKLTYLSPIMNGFQVGVSYTPELGDDSDEDSENFDETDNDFGSVYEIGVRYEGQFNNVGVIVGGGYSHVENENETTAPGAGLPTDDRAAWNLGVDLDIGPFGVGVAYLEDDFGETDTAAAGEDTIDEETTWVVGADYTTGPFKLGASYMNIEGAGNIIGSSGSNGTDGVEAERYAAGVVYTYGPGMTFRGSVSHVELDDVTGITGSDDADATAVVIGTQINF